MNLWLHIEVAYSIYSKPILFREEHNKYGEKQRERLPAGLNEFVANRNIPVTNGNPIENTCMNGSTLFAKRSLDQLYRIIKRWYSDMQQLYINVPIDICTKNPWAVHVWTATL